MKGLIEDGAVLVLPYSHEEYQDRALSRIRRDPLLYDLACHLFPASEREAITRGYRTLVAEAGQAWREDDDQAWIRFATNLGLTPLLDLLIDAVRALDLELDPNLGAQMPATTPQVLAALTNVADLVAAYYDADGLQRKRLGAAIEAALIEQLRSDGPNDVDHLDTLLRLSIPRLDKLSYADLQRARSSQDGLIGLRAAVRRGLAVAATAPRESDWLAYARIALQDEVHLARHDFEAEIAGSRVLSAARTGAQSLVVAAVGAGGAWLAGGSLGAALAGAGGTAGASTMLAMLNGICTRRESSAVLACYVGWDDSALTHEHAESFSTRTISRKDVSPEDLA